MEKTGVGCAVPIERYELLHRYLNMDPTDFPVAERLVDTTLSLPIYPSLCETQVEQVAEALGKFKLCYSLHISRYIPPGLACFTKLR